MALDKPESFVQYVKYAQFVAQIGFASTTFFCFILVFLTMFGVKRNFGSYTYLLILFPVVGIFFATIELVLYPNVYSHNAGYVFYSTSRPFNMGSDAVTWFLAFYTGVYASTISMLSVQFLYRYWAIFEIEMMQKYSTDISEISGMTLVAYDAEGNIRWFNVSCTLNMTSIMLIQYTVIIYCAVFMYRGMEEKLQMLSLSLRNLHKQFFKTLILQIVTPTITLFSPVILIIYLPLLDLEVDLPTGIFLCAFTLYPAMDAVIVMYIVTDYRKAAKRILKKYVERCYAWLSTNEEDHMNSRTKSIAANIPAAMNES